MKNFKKFVNIHKSVQQYVKNRENPRGSSDQEIVRHWNLMYRIIKTDSIEGVLKSEDSNKTQTPVSFTLLVYLCSLFEYELDYEKVKEFYENNYSLFVTRNNPKSYDSKSYSIVWLEKNSKILDLVKDSESFKDLKKNIEVCNEV